MSDTVHPAILIADDHPLFREALQRVAESALPGCAIAEVATLDQALTQAAGRDDLELIFLDLNMPGMNGLQGLLALRTAVPATPILICSASEDPATMQEALTCGASGFIPKSLSRSDMVAAVRQVLDGGLFIPDQAGGSPALSGARSTAEDQTLRDSIAQLTHQQRVVLQMLVGGQSNKIIAYELGIVESTVKAHVSAILRKLRVHSRTQAVIKAGKILSALQQMKGVSL